MSVLVKICGLTREQDVDAAVAAGADMLGFILVATSPRGISVERALELAERVPQTSRTVAVFETAPVTAPGADQGRGFDLVQSYDDPGPGRDDRILAVRGEPPAELPEGVPVQLDLAFGSRPDAAALRAHWMRAAAVRAPVMLAGSLTPDNVADAVRAVRPWAVDTARGVEAAPGVKDPDLIHRFVSEARRAA
jgi:phosphoribosylanthranilate isomerase